MTKPLSPDSPRRDAARRPCILVLPVLVCPQAVPGLWRSSPVPCPPNRLERAMAAVHPPSIPAGG